MSIFVGVLHPNREGVEFEAQLAAVCEEVREADVFVERFEPFGGLPIVNEVGYAALRRAVESKKTHCVLLATEFFPCQGFLKILEKAIEARPNDIISLTANEAAKFLGAGWYTSADGLTAACCLPMEAVKDFLAFSEECLNEHGTCGSIDQNLILWAQFVGSPITHTVPSLVSCPGLVVPPLSPELMEQVDWTAENQAFVGRENAALHWRLISCLKPEYRRVRLAYDLELVRPQLSEKLQALLKPEDSTKQFATPETMMPHVRKTVAGEYDFPTMPHFERPTILDLGANIGAFALWAKRRFPGNTLICYEPHPENVKILNHNLKTFEILASVVEAAVSLQEGPVKLYSGKNNCGEASLTQGIEQTDQFHEVVTISPAELPPADIVKMDTEGVEWEIVQAYRHWDGVRAVMMEFHSAEDRTRITEFLLSHGFDLGKEEVNHPDRGVLCFHRAA